MSGSNPWGDMGAAVGRFVGAHLNDPPVDKNHGRVVTGVWLLALCVYAAVPFLFENNITFAQAVILFVSHPVAFTRAAGAPFMIWAALTLFSLLWIVAGYRGSRRPIDVMRVFWALFWAGVFVAALWWGWYPDSPVLAWYIKGFYIASCAGNLASLGLQLRGADRRARKKAEENLNENRIPWNPPPGRRS